MLASSRNLLVRGASALRGAAPATARFATFKSSSAKPLWDGPKVGEYPIKVRTLGSLSKEQILKVTDLAKAMKKDPHAFTSALKGRTLLALFEKPSLRTRVSLETGMMQLGGHTIFYNLDDSPLGKKESILDTARVVSRYVDVMTARVNTRMAVDELCKEATIPVINALDDYAHPCQMLADLLTIMEHRPAGYANMKLSFIGDCQNNMAYDLMRLACVMGFECVVSGPTEKSFNIEWGVVQECEELAVIGGGKFTICHSRDEAAKDADVIYCDSWMSYGISGDERKERFEALMPFQVTEDTMKLAKKDCLFMNCLPAIRGEEMTAEVLDGPQSVIYDQAENRLWAQKALLTLAVNGMDWKY